MNQYFYKMFLIIGGVILLGAIFAGVFYYRDINPPAANNTNINGSANTNSGSAGISGDDQTKIKKFANYDELKDFLAQAPESGAYFGGGMAMARDAVGLAVPTAPSGISEELMNAGLSQKSMQAGSDYSTTNVQVAGVDEADIIKTDGKYIYAVSGKSIFITEVYPADSAKIISKIELKSTPQNLYLNGDSLVVLGQDDAIYAKMQGELKRIVPSRSSQYAFLKVFDISDKKNPKQVRDLDFEGSINNSRMIGDYVYAVTTTYSYGGDMPIPIILENGEALPTAVGSPRCNCPAVYYFDIPYQSYNLTSIAAINVKDNAKPVKSEVYLLDGNQNMYVSQNNIYIAYTKYINEYQLVLEAMKEMIVPRLNAKDQAQVKKIENTDNDVLSKQEKLAKIGQLIQKYQMTLPQAEQENLQKELEAKMKQKYTDISKELEKTVIHKIAIDKDSLKYQTVGEAAGAVLNQFSMDENGEYFRIATTKNRTWSQFADESGQQESYSNLYVLDKDLKVVGRVENLAPGERIYSVRFMQDRAYMVTFRQTDPLFAIDLKDPKNPKVLGKLKIPGFSNYLHPYDDTMIIGIGKDTEETTITPDCAELPLGSPSNELNIDCLPQPGRVITKGIKISLFDVSDVANPKESAKYVLGDSGSDSIALHDHKAFLFSRDKNLLVIPVQLLDGSDCDSMKGPCPAVIRQINFNGAAVFHIEKDKIELKGKIDHMDGDLGEAGSWYGYGYYGSNVLRSLYIKEILYTMSNKFLKSNKLDDLSEVKKLELKKESANDYIIINE
ncbi:MAG TPA: beta-propeller domain-containing protein [Patescibacteria group bacterium]|nr:beta-propeller domain-containing protein [Patescibacteria group bacterium]